MALFGLIGRTKNLSAGYRGRESASEEAARKRRTGHRRSIFGTARAGQAWEDADRRRIG